MMVVFALISLRNAEKTIKEAAKKEIEEIKGGKKEIFLIEGYCILVKITSCKSRIIMDIVRKLEKIPNVCLIKYFTVIRPKQELNDLSSTEL